MSQREEIEPAIRSAIETAFVALRAGSTCLHCHRRDAGTAEFAISSVLDAVFPPSPDEMQDRARNLPIESLSLTVREYNVLKREGVDTLGDLASRSRLDLMDCRSIGLLTVIKLEDLLRERGLALAKSEPRRY